MSRVIHHQNGDNAFTLTIPDNVAEVYSDGVSEAMIGYPTSKITLHTITQPQSPEQPEQRQAVVRLAIPTAALVELCRNILSVTSGNKENISHSIQQHAKRFDEIMDIPAIPPAPTSESKQT